MIHSGLVRYHDDLKSLMVPIDEVTQHPDNYNNGDLDAIVESIEVNGMYRPLYIQASTGHIVAGNHTWVACKMLDATEVPVVALDIDDEAAHRLLLADNRTAQLARPDDALLLQLLADLADTELGLAGTGYDDLAVKDITDALARAEGTPLLPGDHPTLADRFIISPWTVLDARSGPWQERKHRWLALGIASETGRSGEGQHMGTGPTGQSLRDNPLQYAQRNRNPDGDSYTDGEGVSIFDPVLCELTYRWFTPPGGHIVDPFAGGSVRGIVAAALGHTYTGIELRAEQVAANHEQWADIGAYLDADESPIWMPGDSREILPRLDPGTADLIFTCPPYADLEVYGNDPADISAMKWPQFLDAYRDIIYKASVLLKPDRFAVWVVGEVRDKRTGNYRNLIGETVRAFADAGMPLYNEAILVTPPGSLPLRTGQQFEVSRKLGKTHQNVLTFIKGTGETAARACGPVQVHLPETV